MATQNNSEVRAESAESTEIRCEEKSRGGMCYEMILADPIADKPQPPASTTPRQKSITADDINMKLLQAEERRKSMEASRQASISERLARLEEAGRKREESNLAFISATQLALEDKLDTSSSNREAHLNTLKAKVAEHLSGVELVRRQLEAQSEELRDTINSKLSLAQENRDEQLRKLLDKLKEHDDHAQRVRLGHTEAIRLLEEKIQSKLDAAETNRLAEKLKKLEVLREHSSKVSELQEAQLIKENEMKELKSQKEAAYDDRLRKICEDKEIRRQEQTRAIAARLEQAKETRLKEEQKLKQEAQDRLEQRLELAEKNRAEQQEKFRKSKLESDRRADLVRANKGRLNEDKQETPSSG